MDVKPLVNGLLARNREVMESTMADVEDTHAHWVPPGKALPLGSLYVHVLTAEDFSCTHCANHTSEISTLKGLQGLKGYPF